MVILNLTGRSVKVDELFASIEANRPGRDDVVYLERRGDDYAWRIVPPGGAITPITEAGPEPDAWMSFSVSWPSDPHRLRALFDDLLAELESMVDRTDRCRWPVDEPWPHSH
ncbi:MAG: putative dimethyl sulfoxide reductase chaperone [Mycobacterium sp.]|nr:putative dimethyl sulfoxide reductase chaperone [Mycobacterium sp.]